MDVAAQSLPPAHEESTTAYPFDVFVSYASVPDARLVRALEKFLEGFHRVRLPKGEPLRPLQVCVDGTDFALRRMPRGPTMGVVADAVERALDTYLAQSRLLLVCCSRGAVASRYVRHEIEWFLAQGRECDILLAVTEGANPAAEPEAVFPEPVLARGLHRGLWYDFRGWHFWKRRRWRHVRPFAEARVRLAADVSGVPLETVYPPWWREEIARRLRLAVGALVAAALVVTASAVAVEKMREAWTARLDAQSRGLAATANAILPSDPELAGLLARTAVDTRLTPPAEAALRAAAGVSRIRRPPIEPADARTVRSVAWRSDGRRFLTVAAMADGNDRVQVWDPASGQRDGRPFAPGGAVGAAQFSPGGEQILTLGRAQGAQIWRRGRSLWRRVVALPHRDAVLSGAYAPDGRRVAVGEANADIAIWTIDGASPTLEQRIPSSRSAARVTFDRRGEWLAWASNGQVSMWSAATGTQPLPPGDAQVNSLEFVPDGHLLVAAGHGVTAWRPGADRPDAHLLQSGSIARAARVRAQGDLVAVALDDGSVPILSLAGGAEVVTLRGHHRRINDAVFAPDGESVLTASEDRTARLWSVEPDALQRIEHQRQAADAAFNADGSRLATADLAAWRARIWNPRSGLVRDVQTTFGGATAVAFGPAPSRPCTLLIGSADRTAQAWDLCAGTPGLPLGPLATAPVRVAIDPSGTHALLAARREVRVVTLASNTPAMAPLALDADLLLAGFSGDGGAAVAVTARGAQLVPLAADAPPRTLAPAGAPLTAAALSGDGRVLAVAGPQAVQRFALAEGTSRGAPVPIAAAAVVALDRGGDRLAVAAGDQVLLLDGPREQWLPQREVTAAAFDPRGGLLATAGAGGSIRVWAVADGAPVARELFSPRGNDDSGRVAQLLFSPDGAFLLARSDGPTVQIYGRERFRPLPEVEQLLRQRVTRELTAKERELYLQAIGSWWWS